VSEKRHAIAPDRNREPILAVLQEVLPPAGTVLEIGSGTGQHAVFYADKFPSIVWQPSDVDADALDSIAAWRGEAALPNLRPPIHLDARAEVWDTEPVSAIVAINVVHISPWATCVGMLTGAGRYLLPGGAIIFYGPFLRPDRATAPSNLEFDAEMRRQNPAWGLRDIGVVAAVAESRGLTLDRIVDMPSNNIMAVFRRSALGLS